MDKATVTLPLKDFDNLRRTDKELEKWLSWMREVVEIRNRYDGGEFHKSYYNYLIAEQLDKKINEWIHNLYQIKEEKKV